MNKDIELLTQVSIPVPCPADWSKMTVDERVRHCAQCKLNVYNISAMSTKEAAELIREKEGRLCLRFYRRPDGTIITDNCPKILKGTRDLIAKAAAAILGISSNLEGKGCRCSCADQSILTLNRDGGAILRQGPRMVHQFQFVTKTPKAL